MKYKVLRQHFSGNTVYQEGDTRECDERKASELIKNGLIEKVKTTKPPQNKAKQPHKNK